MGKVKDFFEDMNFFKKHFAPAIQDFVRKPSLTKQFDEIRNDITDGKHPVIICEKISSVLKSGLFEYYNKLELDLNIPVVALKNDNIGIARNINKHWRLIGFGEII